MYKSNLQELIKKEFIKLLSEDGAIAQSLVRRDNPVNLKYALDQEDYTTLPAGLANVSNKSKGVYDVAKDTIKKIKNLGVGVSVRGKGWHGKVPKVKRAGSALNTGLSYTGNFEESQKYLKQVIEEELEAILNEYKSD